MMLFDNSRVGGNDPASYTEPEFSFLNRSSRAEFARIRDVLEIWFEHYPLSEQPEFRSRFRSTNDFQYRAAFFELFLHELHLQLDCKLQLHPSLNNTAKLPDFLVQPQHGSRSYLEATVATGETAQETAARARE